MEPMGEGGGERGARGCWGPQVTGGGGHEGAGVQWVNGGHEGAGVHSDWRRGA